MKPYLRALSLNLMIAAFASPVFISSAHAANLPQSVSLQYAGHYNGLTLPATMTFTRNGKGYKVVSTIKVPLYHIRFESGGSISGNTIRPSYYKDVRGGKTYAEAKFRGNQVTYGKTGELQTETVGGNISDLFTLAWQLAANDAKLPARLSITNGKKIYPVSGMNKIGSGSYTLNGKAIPVEKYRVQRGDDTVTYSFATSLGNIPAQISYTDDGKTYDLKLTSVSINGKPVKP